MSTTFRNEPRGTATENLLPRFPFQEPDCDIIIRSCDGMEFRTFKLFLSLASKAFSNMFIVAKSGDEVQIVDLEEDGVTLDLLLSFCDLRPGQHQHQSPTVETVVSAIESAEKYEMDRAIESLSTILVSHAASTPVRIYAIGCHMLKTSPVLGALVARGAALHSLGSELKPHSSEETRFVEVQTLPSKYTFSLQMFHEACGKVASQQVCDLSWYSGSTPDKSRFSWLPVTKHDEQYYYNKNYHPYYWTTFLEQLGGRLGNTPRPLSVPDFLVTAGLELLTPSSINRVALSTFYRDFKLFEDELLIQIDKAIGKVPLNLGV